MTWGKLAAVAAAMAAAVLGSAPAASSAGNPGSAKLEAMMALKGAGGGAASRIVLDNFRLLGHHGLNPEQANGDVWVHGNVAYVGTWREPCTGSGVSILDVSDLRNPELIGRLAERESTSAEDVVVRRVTTPFFSGDLLAVGIQRCDFDNPELDTQPFGVQLWNVTNPYAPVFLIEFPLETGGGAVHELDLFQRGDKVYALLAHPFGEWFTEFNDFVIVDVTNPAFPVALSDWGAGENGFAPGPFWGQGDFSATYGHSVRASADGTKAYVSYWDLGVLTFDITDPAKPVLLTRTTYEPWEDGDAHSMTPYENRRGRELILQNDEDVAVMTPADIDYGARRHGLGNEGFAAPLIWNRPGHKLSGQVVMASNQGCSAADYPAETAGKIAVVYTPWPFFDPGGGDEPLCLHQEQEAAAAAAGAIAVVHDFVAENTSPQWMDFAPIDIHVLFTDHETAQGMVANGWVRIKARKPSWGYLRVYDAETGEQVASFDGAPNVHRAPAEPGVWTIHNTEVLGDRAYSSWYTNGIVALDLGPLDRRKPGDPKMVGRFTPPRSGEGFSFSGIWGVFVRADGVIFGSDMGSGLWIVKPKGKAAP